MQLDFRYQSAIWPLIPLFNSNYNLEYMKEENTHLVMHTVLQQNPVHKISTFISDACTRDLHDEQVTVPKYGLMK